MRLHATRLLTCLIALLLCTATARGDEQPNAPAPGVSFKLYHLAESLSELATPAEGALPNVHEVRPTIDFAAWPDLSDRQNNFLVEVDALLRVARPGVYRLRMSNDDGAQLWIDGKTVISHDGAHPASWVEGEVELARGDHPLAIRMFQAAGEAELRLQWMPPGSDRFETVPASVLFNTAGDDRPTADGNKPVRRRGIRAARPGAGRPLEAVHPGFMLEQARPEGFEPQVGGLAFLPDGRLAVTSFQPLNNGVFREDYNGTLYILDNPTATDTSQIKVHKVSEELHDPLGLNWHDGALFVADRNEVSKWTDTDDDGYPDRRETFASGWISDNYHMFTFGLPYHDGGFYITLSTNITFANNIRDEHIIGPVIAMNGPNPAYRGCLLRIDAETGEITTVAGGLRTPNGVSLGPDGLILCPDNQGAWKPSSGIYAGKQGAFWGYYNNTAAKSDFYPDGGDPSAFSDKPVTPPAVYLPQNEASNSPGEMVLIPEGQPHAGQMLMAEITLGGLRRVFLEQVDGVWQGAVFRHSQGFEAGLNRLAWGPDGCLYVGGMGQGAGNWGWENKRFGLQRMRPTGETAFEFEKIEATADGFRVSFTKPVPKEQLEDLSAWAIDAWTYTPTPDYGGPKIDNHRADPTAAVASADRMSVVLTVPNRRSDYVYYIRTDPTSDDGDTMWSPEAWVTFHNAPAR